MKILISQTIDISCMLLIKTAEITHLHRFPCLNVLCILIRIHISKTHFYAYILYMSVTAATLQVNKSACMMHPFSDKHFKHCYCFACGESYKLKYCISSVFFIFYFYKSSKYFKQLSTSSDRQNNPVLFLCNSSINIY